MGRKLPVKRVRVPLESVVERALIGAVARAGGLCEKVTVVGRRGFVDRLVVLPAHYPHGPRILFVEVKRPRGGRVSPHQKQWHAQLKALGVAVAIVRTTGDVEALMTDS